MKANYAITSVSTCAAGQSSMGRTRQSSGPTAYKAKATINARKSSSGSLHIQNENSWEIQISSSHLKRVETRNHDVNAEVELVPVDEERIVNVP